MNIIHNIGLLVLKIGGMLLFFFITKFIMKVVFGSRMDFFLDNFWVFVIAGLIPAFIAWFRGINFWAWWLGGTFFPFMSTILVISLDLSEFSDETTVVKDGQDIVEQNNNNSKMK